MRRRQVVERDAVRDLGERLVPYEVTRRPDPPRQETSSAATPRRRRPLIASR